MVDSPRKRSASGPRPGTMASFKVETKRNHYCRRHFGFLALGLSLAIKFTCVPVTQMAGCVCIQQPARDPGSLPEPG